ncbi:BREX system P-loop protein BrxC [Rhodospirillales bacterium]|nr:BREX system P-loop protein BrxC [Rhodospirillales bacterium]
MKIKELFTKPINRSINGVIKAEQMDVDSVWQELEEFVVTKELDIHLRKFLDTYLNAIDNPNDPSVAGKVGVWVSGFFGSGKSHFIKILSYLLENKEITKDGVAQRAIDFFKDKIQDPMLAGDIKRAAGADTDVILFNIDTKADNADGRDVILRVFLKVFNERLGFSGDHPHIAHMERYLVKQGKYEEFKTAFKDETGEDWYLERDAYNFHSEGLTAALSKSLGQDIKDAEAWLERFEGDFSLSVENLAKWVKEYLDSKGKNHRIMFLVDEVGQFIGRSVPLMLNLQTITENLGTVCGGRAWVVVTSQEDMDAVLGDFPAIEANNFSRIQARFKTRLSLSGANADEVIQKRLLSKVDEAKAKLTKVYADKSDILKNQLSFKNTGMTFKPYADAEDFVAVYPFAPYQFQLVQKIFESTRRSGATGAHLAKGERSMLDAFQTAAVDVSGEDIGVLTPLYRFYPAIESFLEGIVRSAIQSVDTNPSLEPFDAQVLKTLFLIRYVDEITGNVENLITLFIDHIDANRRDLRDKIEASLQRLEGQTLVSRNGEDYFFLTNEERDINREIKDVDLNTSEEVKFLGELIYDDILKDLRKYRYPINNKDFDVTRLCDLHPYGNKTDGSLILSVITPMADDYDVYNEAKCINQSTMDDGQVVIKLEDDPLLAREIRTYLQTDKYITRKNDGTATPTTRKILQQCADDNRQRRERLNVVVDRLMMEAKFYAAGQSRKQPTGSVSAGVDESLSYLIQNTFPKLGYLKHPSKDPQKEIRAVLSAPPDDGLGLEGGEANSEALQEVINYVSLMDSKNHKVVLYDLVSDRFSRRPYGWHDWESVLLVVRLVMMGELSLTGSGGTLPTDKIYAAIDGTNKWRNVTVVKRQTVDKGQLQSARSIAKDVFEVIAPDGEDKLTAHIRGELDSWKTSLGEWKSLADTGSYPGSSDIADASGVVAKALAIQESYQFVGHFIEFKDDFNDLSDTMGELRNFYTSQRPTWERLRNSQTKFDLNRHGLEKDADAAANLKRIEEILNNPAPYGMIKDADGLIAKVSSVNDALIKKHRDHAISRIDGHISKVQVELDDVGASPEIRNQCLSPIQKIKAGVEEQVSVAHIHQSQSNALEAVDDAFAIIEAAAKSKPKTLPENDGGTDKPLPPPIPSKKRRVVEPTKLVTQNFLENKEDVDAFLEKLREELEEAINNNERVEIR